MKKILMFVLCCMMIAPAFGDRNNDGNYMASCPAKESIRLVGQNGHDNEFVYDTKAAFDSVTSCTERSKQDCNISGGRVFECDRSGDGCPNESHLYGYKDWIHARRGNREQTLSEDMILRCNGNHWNLYSIGNCTELDWYKKQDCMAINFQNTEANNKECYKRRNRNQYCCVDNPKPSTGNGNSGGGNPPAGNGNNGNGGKPPRNNGNSGGGNSPANGGNGDVNIGGDVSVTINPPAQQPVVYQCPALDWSWRETYVSCDGFVAAFDDIDIYCRLQDRSENEYMSKYNALKSLKDKCDAQWNSGRNTQTMTITMNAKKFNDAMSVFKANVWKNAEGNFNTARLASDSIAGVVLGTAGGLITSHLVKKGQVKSGFEDIQCTVGGQKVADWGDEFTVGIQ